MRFTLVNPFEVYELQNGEWYVNGSKATQSQLITAIFEALEIGQPVKAEYTD